MRTLDEVGQLVDALIGESINRYLAEHPPAGFYDRHARPGAAEGDGLMLRRFGRGNAKAMTTGRMTNTEDCSNPKPSRRRTQCASDAFRRLRHSMSSSSFAWIDQQLKSIHTRSIPMEFLKAKLDNGLEIVAECNDEAHSTAVGFFVQTGARDETDDVVRREPFSRAHDVQGHRQADGRRM